MSKFTLDWKQYAALARQAAAEGCVLLENKNNTLPLAEGETCAVFGRTQFEYYKSGTGSGGLVNTSYVHDLDYALTESSLIIDEEVKNIIDTCYKDAKKIIEDHMEQLQKCAQMLIEKEKINQQEFESIF